MNSATDFWGLIFITVVAGIVYLASCKNIFKWWDKRKKK